MDIIHIHDKPAKNILQIFTNLKYFMKWAKYFYEF